MNIYELSRNYFDWCFENPEKISPSHTAIYFFAIEHCNRLGWKEKFGFPTQMVMDAIGIKKHQTYIKYLNDLVDWGFIKLVQKSANQYSANIISLKSAAPKKGKALDKAMVKHMAKQTESNRQSTGQSTGQSTRQSTGSIDIQYYKDTNIHSTSSVAIPKDTSKPKVEVSEFDKQIRAYSKEFFLILYKERNNTEYIWSAKDAKSMNSFLNKVKSKCKETAEQELSEDELIEYVTRSVKATLLNIKDNWILNNFNYSIFNSKFNEIYSQIKNNKHGHNSKLAEQQATLEFALQFIKGGN